MSLQHGSLGRIPIPTVMQITLTDKEAQICDLLDACTKALKEEKCITTSCRIAGGWVRDKLLGADSNDIDIALSDMMGLQFAEHLAEFAQRKGIETGSINTIAQNPDQSKHLETATFRFLGLDIDLVNLRSEEYASDSRIPTEVLLICLKKTFGTPLQDALRRDITINAMFYNVHTREVEDHTGKGLDDLRNGVVRTPLPPRETFLDDPLRVLRCIRFASRFGFSIVPEVQEAAQDTVIQRALVTKVARERAGEELSKMMKGRDPLGAIQIIRDLSLYDSLFSIVPLDILETFSSPPAAPDVAFTATLITHNLLHPEQSSPLPALHPNYISAIDSDPTCRARLYLAAILTPYKEITYQYKKKTPLAIEYIIRDVLKLGTQNHFLDGIPALFASSTLLENPVLTSERFPHPSQRVALGLLLREKNVHNSNTGSHWTISLFFALIQELVPLYHSATDTLNSARHIVFLHTYLSNHAQLADAGSRLIDIYNAFMVKVEELDLPGTVEAKPILDGREVVQTLGAKQSGAWTGKVMATLLEWQLDNPGATKEEARSWLSDQQRQGKIQIDAEPANKRVRTK
ncbi:hypothetical protein H0H92_007464 [Tricholoma furcatifolium]|nr:hypothetical protein H0H92_007464 [Tricholoma furcatifolium]